jgi:hypothetical protein
MAFTTGQTPAQLATELVSAGVCTNGTVLQDQANNAVASLALQPVGTIAVLWGILCKVTTSAQTTTAVFSYDASPS